MIEISKLIHEGISKEESFLKIKPFLKEDSLQLTSKYYQEYYYGKEPNEVLAYIRKNKFYRRKKNWTTKALDGLKQYKKDPSVKEKGFAAHLVEKYKLMQAYEKQKGQLSFEKLFKETNSETAAASYIQELKVWQNTKASCICEYPFFSELTKKQQQSALEIDLCILIGQWLVFHLKQVEIKTVQNGNLMIDPKSVSPIKNFVERAPTTSLSTSYWGVASKESAVFEAETNINHTSLMQVKQKKKHTMPKNTDLLIDTTIFDTYRFIQERKKSLLPEELKKKETSYGEKIKTLSMADWRLFVYLINHRHKKFQQNRKIQVYFSDIIEENEKSDSQSTYDVIIDQLLRLGFFRIASKTADGKIHISSLFSDMIIDKDEKGKWYVTAVVSDSVYDDVIKQQTINIYNKKVQEISNDFAYHLVFVIQKERILCNTEENDEIILSMEWEDFSSIRFNKRTKKENFDEIENALNEIKKMDFLVKDFSRIGNRSFLISTYPLNDYELEDMNNYKLEDMDDMKLTLEAKN